MRRRRSGDLDEEKANQTWKERNRGREQEGVERGREGKGSREE